MRNDKHIATNLRQKGMSYKEIRASLGIPLSTLSDWFSEAGWSQVVRKDLEKRLGNKLSIAGKKRWKRWHEAARAEGKREYPLLKHDLLFISGLMLYWGEGDSKVENSNVRLTNTNPNIMRLFKKFLVEICKVPEENLRAAMILYPDLDETICKQFWTTATGIPSTRFFKTQYIRGKHPTKRLSYGILQIAHGNRRLKEKMFVWINMFQKEYP